MSAEFVWTQTGGNSWSVRRASPPSVLTLSPWWPTPDPYQALMNANADTQALAASETPGGAGLDAALAGNIWAYLGGRPK